MVAAEDETELLPASLSLLGSFRTHSGRVFVTVAHSFQTVVNVTYRVDGDDDGLCVEPGPGHVDLQLVDVPGHEREGQPELLLQHLQPQVQVAEGDVASPQGHLQNSRDVKKNLIGRGSPCLTCDWSALMFLTYFST